MLKPAAPRYLLKVIIETGSWKEEALIRRASDLPSTPGADFIKTSTGEGAGERDTKAARIADARCQARTRKWASSRPVA